MLDYIAYASIAAALFDLALKCAARHHGDAFASVGRIISGDSGIATDNAQLVAILREFD
jgi:hypothetical protein